MRICIVTPYDLSHDGGVNRHARSLARALGELGHAAAVVGPASGDVPEGCHGLPGVVPVRANGSVARIGLLVHPRATRAFLAAHDFDLVHVHEPIVPGPGRHALRFADVPVVATFHANAEREVGVQKVIRRAVAGNLSRIAFGIAVSRQAKAFSRTIYRGRTAVIPNGVDLSRFAGALYREGALPPVLARGLGAPSPPGEAGRDPTPAWPRPAELEDRPARVLFVGRFGEKRKGFASLVDAVALLRGQGRPVEVDVVGDGPIARWQERGAQLGIRFHGRLSDAALAERYRGADVFCAPSLGGESFGMVLVEAMAAGCPVVASDIPGYAEAARGAALLTPRGDPGRLAVALWRAARDPELRARLAERGRARADALCWSRVAGRVLHIYRAALHEAAEREAAPAELAGALAPGARGWRA